jgi:FkbM family methyltransferase
MNLFNYFVKPEYFYRPSSFLKKLFLPKQGILMVDTIIKGTKMEVDISDNIGKSIARFGFYDLSVTELLFQILQPDYFCIDVGANIGFTTMIFSHGIGPNGKVFAFEPNRKLLERLYKNTIISNNVSLFPFALSNQNGLGELIIPFGFNSNHGIGYVKENPEINSKEFESISIEIKKLDDILPVSQFIDVMKIDVEGHELKVLQGAYNLLSEKRIRHIVYEDHLSYPSEVSDYLINFGYSIYRIEKKMNTICLYDPLSVSNVSNWEATNYLATIDNSIVKKIRSSNSFICFKNH